MADRILFITWKAPVRGLEERAVESFNEAIGLYGRMQQEGRIESFDVALLNLDRRPRRLPPAQRDGASSSRP